MPGNKEFDQQSSEDRYAGLLKNQSILDGKKGTVHVFNCSWRIHRRILCLNETAT